MSDPVWIQPVLTAIRNTGVVSQAARQVGVSPVTVYARRKADPAFDTAVLEALEESTDVLEAEMVRRAVEGVDEPVVYQGSLTYMQDPLGQPDPVSGRRPPLLDGQGRPRVLTVNKKSDTLLMFGLKGRRKAYATERQELTGADGTALVSPLTEIERASRLAALVELAQRRKADADDML